MYPLKYLERITQFDAGQKEFNEHQKLYPKNPFTELTEAKSEVNVEAGVKLPSQQNAILIMFKDNLDNPRIDMTPYLWDILKAIEDQEFLFTKELDGWKCEINISMARSV
jgi:hypothetical protein